ncbi:hypothetical protein BMETH_1165_1 [methanotrophic bacterial endosymbiont of Bathymodiolus sp.]|nr:hypothetical protein BMETH_1165_1 [methanotrophic bacterial endosymbiont of Bathymodiolus sp.]
MLPERSPRGTISLWSSICSNKSNASRSATICLRAATRSKPM